MTYARTRFSLALGLSLAGCAVPSAPSPSLALEDLPRAHQATTETSQMQTPAIALGHVVLTRTEEAMAPTASTDVENQMKQALAQNAELAARVSATLAQVSQQSVKPEQAQAIAQQAVEEAAPQFRALALQSVKDSQDYIRTVARNAVQSDDPAMKTALTDAARDAISKDDRIVFAIRKVVTDEMETAKSSTHAVAAMGTDPAVTEFDLANIAPAAGDVSASELEQADLSRARTQWMDLRQYRVVVHEDGKTLEEMLNTVLTRARPFTGPWTIKWKISEENKDILQERFSLDVETSFDEFVSYLVQYMVNDRGIKISFSLFDADRIIVVSD